MLQTVYAKTSKLDELCNLQHDDVIFVLSLIDILWLLQFVEAIAIRDLSSVIPAPIEDDGHIGLMKTANFISAHSSSRYLCCWINHRFLEKPFGDCSDNFSDSMIICMA